MKRYLCVETKRLFHSPMAIVLVCLTLCSPLAGYFFYQPVYGDTETSLMLGNPVVCGAIAGTILFALLTLLELDRPQKYGIAALTESLVSPGRLHIARLISVFLLATATSFIAAILYLPYTGFTLGNLFSTSTYFFCWVLFFWPALIAGAMAATIGYQIVGRVDVAFVAVLALMFISRSQWFSQNPFMQWSAPFVPALTDNFSNAAVFRITLYARLIWFLLLSGLWILSFLCIRQYGKGIFSSFLFHARHFVLPVISVFLLAGGISLFHYQPFFDHSPIDYAGKDPMDLNPDIYTAPKGVVLHKAELELDLSRNILGTLSGQGLFLLENSSGTEAALVFELNSGYTIQSIKANGKLVPFTDLHDDYIGSRGIYFTLPAEQNIKLEVTYKGLPQIWNTMSYSFDGPIIAPGFVSLSSSQLGPRFLIEQADDVSIQVHCMLPTALVPVTNGEEPQLLGKPSDNTQEWLLSANGSASLQLYAGPYIKYELYGGDSPIQFYYSHKYQPLLSQGGALDVMKAAVEYCTSHYGPRTSIQGKPFRIVQNTAFEFGGGAHQDFSTMGEGYFTDHNLNDPQKGAGSAEVLAHEIIHQWWGLSATLMDDNNGDWSDEGITTYATYRLIKELRGEEYAEKHYVEKWRESVRNKNNNFYFRHPEYLDKLPEEYQASIKGMAWSVNHYDGMALSFYRAAQFVGGEEKLDDILSGLYQNGGTEMPPYISFSDFLDACNITEEELLHD